VPLEQVHHGRAVGHQHRRGDQEADQVPAPEYRPDQADTEDQPHRREDHRGQRERMPERVPDRAPGQDAAYSQVDPVHHRQGSPDGPPYALGAEVPRRDQHDPQREQREQVQGRLGSRFIRGQAPTGTVRTMIAAGIRARPPSIIVHGHQRGRATPGLPMTTWTMIRARQASGQARRAPGRGRGLPARPQAHRHGRPGHRGTGPGRRRRLSWQPGPRSPDRARKAPPGA